VYAQEADQIVGDVFAHLLDKLAEEKSPCKNLRSYLFQIADHLVIDHARDRIHTAPLEVGVSVNEEMEPVQSMVEEKLILEKHSIAMERNLTEEQRNLIVLRFQEDFCPTETAEIVGIKVNAVKALQNRGINTLRQAMGRLDKEH